MRWHFSGQKGLKDKLGLDEIILVVKQSGLRWYGHVLRKEDNAWMKARMEYEVGLPGQESDQRKLGQRLWEKTVRDNRP